jgi:hypothetical protein
MPIEPSDIVSALVHQSFPIPYTTLVSLSIAPNQYLGDSFQIVPNIVSWRPKPGSWQNLHGMWIWRRYSHQCLQAVNAGGGPLTYWNADNRLGLNSNPADWELFLFETVDANQGQVRIKQVYGAYINYVAPLFKCTGNQAQAQIFTVAAQPEIPWAGGNPYLSPETADS